MISSASFKQCVGFYLPISSCYLSPGIFRFDSTQFIILNSHLIELDLFLKLRGFRFEFRFDWWGTLLLTCELLRLFLSLCRMEKTWRKFMFRKQRLITSLQNGIDAFSSSCIVLPKPGKSWFSFSKVYFFLDFHQWGICFGTQIHNYKMGFAFPISIFSVKRTMQFIIFKASILLRLWWNWIKEDP